MDCLEFRRRLAADPHSRDPEFIAHRDSCKAGCRSWWRAQHFEHRIVDALGSVDVPPDLVERVLLAQATASRADAHSRHRLRIAVAMAALLLVASIAVGYAWVARGAGDSLPAMAIADILGDEVYSLTLTVPVDGQEMHKVFAKRGLNVRGMPRHAVYASDCMLGPYRAVHLVLRENGKPVTAMYVVGHRIRHARNFEKSHWRGRELPMGDGTLVLLGFGTQGFGEAERAVSDAVLGPVRERSDGA